LFLHVSTSFTAYSGVLCGECAFIGVTNEYLSQGARNEVSKQENFVFVSSFFSFHKDKCVNY